MVLHEYVSELPMWPKQSQFPIEEPEVGNVITQGFFEEYPPTQEVQEFLTGLFLTKDTDFNIDCFWADISEETFKIIMSFYKHTYSLKQIKLLIIDAIDCMGFCAVDSKNFRKMLVVFMRGCISGFSKHSNLTINFVWIFFMNVIIILWTPSKNLNTIF